LPRAPGARALGRASLDGRSWAILYCLAARVVEWSLSRARSECARSMHAVKDSMVAYSGMAKGEQFRCCHQAIFKDSSATVQPAPRLAGASTWEGLDTAG